MKMNEKGHTRAYPALVTDAMALVTIRLAKPEEGIWCLAPAECCVDENPTSLLNAEVIRVAKVELQIQQQTIRRNSNNNMSLVDVTFSVGLVNGDLRVASKIRRVFDGADPKTAQVLDWQGDIDALSGFYKARMKAKAA